MADAWLAVFRRRHPRVGLGHPVHLDGVPVFQFAESATVKIGSAVVFTSRPRANLAGLAKGCSLYAGPGATLTIGDGCGFSGVSIFCSKRIEIGDRLTCGVNASIWDTDFHPLDHVHRRRNAPEHIAAAAIRIGDDVFIGANTMILKGVTIGDRAIVGAGAVVTRAIPADEIWGGNPARFIRKVAG